MKHKIPIPRKPKNITKIKNKHCPKASRNAAPDHMSVLEWVSCKWTHSNDWLYSNRKLKRKYNKKFIILNYWPFLIYETVTTVDYGKLR